MPRKSAFDSAPGHSYCPHAARILTDFNRPKAVAVGAEGKASSRIVGRKPRREWLSPHHPGVIANFRICPAPAGAAPRFDT